MKEGDSVLAEQRKINIETAISNEAEIQSTPSRRVSTGTTKRPSARALVLVLALAVVFGVVVMRYAGLSERTLEVNELKQELTQAQIDAEYVRLQLSMASSLGDISRIARDDLMMNIPGRDQVEYIEVPEAVPQAQVPEETPSPNWFDAFLSLLE